MTNSEMLLLENYAHLVALLEQAEALATILKLVTEGDQSDHLTDMARQLKELGYEIDSMVAALNPSSPPPHKPHKP